MARRIIAQQAVALHALIVTCNLCWTLGLRWLPIRNIPSLARTRAAQAALTPVFR